jgi:hypothetical protein
VFIELFKPRVIDIYQTRDRVKLRIGEPEAAGRFWINATFENMEQLKDFAARVLDAITDALATPPPP